MSKIVSVHSFRGGTGKSNLTANLATLVARQGKRVAVIDTDIQSPGAHVLFGLDEARAKHSLNDYLWGKCAITDAAYDVSSALELAPGDDAAGSLWLTPSSMKAGDIVRALREGYDVARLNDGFQELIRRLQLDYLFIDTHPGLHEETLLSITVSDTVLILLRPDQQDFQGTAVTVDVAKRLGVPRMLLALNQALPSFDFQELRERLAEIYQTPVSGILPFDEDLIRLASSGVFALRHPDHPWTTEARAIAQQIME